jgi:glutaminyl-tRNA synthetase
MAETDIRPTNFVRQIVDKDLQEGTHDRVQTRFPPEPNGYLHIGHAKSICLNFGLAEDYQGACNLRFDDTNPEKEDIDYVNSIKEDVNWLGYTWSGDICYSSNYFPKLYEFAVELISKGLAYVDFSSQEEMREMRGTLKSPGVDSPYRNTLPEENIELFNKMKAGEFKEGECCLRAKIDMTSSFMCMRDPVIYRVRFAHHHQTGDEWCIYPMYDFTHCISDALEGITHSLCTLEFQDNRRLYDWVIDNISAPAIPKQYEFSRLNLAYTVLSKRKLIQLVDENYVSGWDDPRMPTIAGLRRRGYTPASIREFCQRIGVTKMDNVIEVSNLEGCIRDDLNVAANRAMAVLNPIKVVIENYPEGQIEELTAANHPNDEAKGNRILPFGREVYIEREDFKLEANKKFKRLVLNKEVRLRNAYVIKAERVDTDEQGEITTIYCTYDDETLGRDPSDGRKVKGVIHWVSADKGLNAEVRLYDRLFKVENPNGVELSEAINQESLEMINAVVEPSLADAEVGVAVQFERTGYFCKDPDSTESSLVFNRTVGLRDTWSNSN